MKIELDYVKVGDYYLPDLTAEPYPKRGLGKYGLLRLRYLKEHRPIVWAELVMGGKTVFRSRGCRPRPAGQHDAGNGKGGRGHRGFESP